MLCRRGEARNGVGIWLSLLALGRAFDWSCSPRGGDIWIFLRLTWRYLTAYSDEKDWDRTHVSHFHASRMRRTVWKDLEIMEANENKRKLGGFHCLSSNFVCFIKVNGSKEQPSRFLQVQWSVYDSFATITVSQENRLLCKLIKWLCLYSLLRTVYLNLQNVDFLLKVSVFYAV